LSLKKAIWLECSKIRQIEPKFFRTNILGMSVRKEMIRQVKKGSTISVEAGFKKGFSGVRE
jgi:hypothetical protein